MPSLLYLEAAAVMQTEVTGCAGRGAPDTDYKPQA